MSKKLWQSNRLHKRPIVSLLGVPCPVTLPPGCVGVQFVFETKKAARAWDGDKAVLIQIEQYEPEP